jgi:hypothetical protein
VVITDVFFEYYYQVGLKIAEFASIFFQRGRFPSERFPFAAVAFRIFYEDRFCGNLTLVTSGDTGETFSCQFTRWLN